jgi:hypothetical protein
MMHSGYFYSRIIDGINAVKSFEVGSSLQYFPAPSRAKGLNASSNRFNCKFWNRNAVVWFFLLFSSQVVQPTKKINGHNCWLFVLPYQGHWQQETKHDLYLLKVMSPKRGSSSKYRISPITNAFPYHCNPALWLCFLVTI